ncbi:MAG: hypothetical protein DVB31_02830 [Verrucomicrobia bacterium]|nr:MAG: hypothetical protein DVB31_02830 [Verrucomicrobiota bacterium]
MNSADRILGPREEDRTPGTWTVGDWRILVLLLGGLSAIYHWVTPSEVVHTCDPAVYLSGAESLSQGHGYGFVGWVDEPRIGLYPPGHSFALSWIWRLRPGFPDNAGYLVGWMSWLGAASMTLAFAVLRRFGVPRVPAVIGVVFMGTAPVWLATIKALGSEPQFLLLCLLAMLPWAMGRPNSFAARCWISGVALGFAYLTRSAAQSFGLALVPVAIWLVCRRKAVAATGLLAPLAACAAFWQWLSSTGIRYPEIFKAHMGGSVAAYLHVVKGNLGEIALGLPFWRLVCPYIGFLPGIARRFGALPGTLVWVVSFGLFVVFMAILVKAALRERRQFVRVMLWLAIVYAAQVAMLPVQPDHFGRFGLPLYPLVILLVWQGVRHSSTQKWLLCGFLAFSAVLNVAYLVRMDDRVAQRRALAEVREAADWLRANTRPDDAIGMAWGMPFAHVHGWSGRRFIADYLGNPYESGEPVRHRQQRRLPPQYLFVDSRAPREEVPRGLLSLRFATSQDRFRIYRVDPTVDAAYRAEIRSRDR